MIIFDGTTFARQREELLAAQIPGKQLKIAAVLFGEDKGSILYTRLKQEAAERVGIAYQVVTFSMLDPISTILTQIVALNDQTDVTGIIIQKPWRQRWLDVQREQGRGVEKSDFDEWWHQLVSAIGERKDVDGLHPQTLRAIEQGTWQEEGRVLPATCQAVVDILAAAQQQLQLTAAELAHKRMVILGKSDILGKPLFYELKNRGYQVEMWGSAELKAHQESGRHLQEADVIISSTGHKHLVTGEMVKTGVIVIDVGEPKPDVEFATVSPKASFITPVPGGVGPVTVVSLLENVTKLLPQD